MWELYVASLHSEELGLIPRRFHGGWLAPNIYYLGQAGVIVVNGIKIAGVSGIFKGHDFRYGKFAFYGLDLFFN